MNPNNTLPWTSPQQQQQQAPVHFVQPVPPRKKPGNFVISNGAEDFKNKWAIGMCDAPCENTGFCLMSCFCPWCCAYRQRKRLLLNNLNNYVCCAGMFGSCSERCTNCCGGQLGLCLESWLCVGCAVHGNRWMIQSTYGLENTTCDVFIMYVACICSWLACLAAIFCDSSLADALNNIADLIFHIVMGCMLAQHDYELNHRQFPSIDGKGPKPQAMR
jgi:hypothetical protein